VGALVVEALLFTYSRNQLGDYVSPVVLLLSAVLACVATYFYTRHATWQSVFNEPLITSRLGAKIAVGLACVVGVTWCAVKWHAVLRGADIKISSSDIIPSLSIYTKRFLAGEIVYTPFTEELGYQLYPTYLPAMWGPFLLPEWLRIDYRWISGLLMLVGIGAYQAVVLHIRRGAALTFLLALLPFGLTRAVLHSDESIGTQTVEFMIVGYYMLLVAGILLPSWWAQTLGLLLCLLSRYSLVFWVPLYIGLVFFQKSKREAVLTVAALALGAGVLFVLPFLSHDWELLSRAQETYTGAALGEWQHLNDQGLPYHLYNGIGVGNLFYRYGSDDLMARITLLKHTHLLLLVSVVSGATLLYWRQPRPRTDYRIFAVLVLKVYLAVFYAFIQVPYFYLAIVSLFSSLFLLLLLLGTQHNTINAPVEAA
jgi:hypothetical protein